MSARTTIYIPNRDTLNSIQDQAQQKRWSISKYLIWLHDKYVENILPEESKELTFLSDAVKETHEKVLSEADDVPDPFFKPAPKPGQKVNK